MDIFKDFICATILKFLKGSSTKMFLSMNMCQKGDCKYTRTYLGGVSLLFMIFDEFHPTFTTLQSLWMRYIKFQTQVFLMLLV
jgi:hypothetical protein